MNDDIGMKVDFKMIDIVDTEILVSVGINMLEHWPQHNRSLWGLSRQEYWKLLSKREINITKITPTIKTKIKTTLETTITQTITNDSGKLETITTTTSAATTPQMKKEAETTARREESAIQLMDTWNSENRDSVKLVLSSCLLTSDFIIKLNSDASLISGIIKLNLASNPLMQEGGIDLASLFKNPKCCLKVINLNNCQLGLLSVLNVLEALSDNKSLEEHNLSENALQDEYNTLVKVNEHQDGQRDLFDLEVADSEDEADGWIKVGQNGNCLLGSKSKFVQDLASAVSMAKKLKLLDFSNNGFSEKVGEMLYDSWSKNSRVGLTLTKKHIKGSIVHLSVEHIQCCNVKPCCTRF